MRRPDAAVATTRPIGRRRFLRLSALGAAVGRTVVRPSSNARDELPVVVVGAGLAGLRAAAVLRDAGRRVVVLEARASRRQACRRFARRSARVCTQKPDRFGSRARKDRPEACERDHGSTLVPFASTTGASVISVRGSRRTSRRAPESGFHARPETRRSRTWPVQPPPTLRTAIFPPTWTRRCRRRSCIDVGDARSCNVARVAASARRVGWRRDADDARRGLERAIGFVRAPAGRAPEEHGAVLQDSRRDGSASAERWRRRWKTPSDTTRRSSGIDQSRDSVLIGYLANGRAASIRASHVDPRHPVFDAPTDRRSTAFSAAKKHAIDSLPYFPATRFLLQSEARFWEDAGLTGTARTDQPAEVWDCTYDLPATAGILGATVGRCAWATSLSSMERSRALNAGVPSSCRSIFPELTHELREGERVPVGARPMVAGRVRRLSSGADAALMPEIPRPEARLHFAGEHTSSWMGWMEGALESGEPRGA